MLLNFDIEIQSLPRKDVVIAISQSGETADTLAALELAKSKAQQFWAFAMLLDHHFSHHTMVVYTPRRTRNWSSSHESIYRSGHGFKPFSAYRWAKKGPLTEASLTRLLRFK